MSFNRSPRGDGEPDAPWDWLARQAAEARARRGPGGRPPRPTGSRSGARPPFGRAVVTAVGVVVVILFLLGIVSGPLADYLWFQNVGFGAVWSTRFGYGLGLFVAGLVIAAVYLLGNLALAWRLSHDPTDDEAAIRARVTSAAPGDQIDILAVAAALPRRAIRLGLLGAGLVLAILFGLGLSAAWQTVALWLHETPFATTGAPVTDPIFGADLGWWLLSLPVLHLVADTAAFLGVLGLLLTGAAYGVAAARGGNATSRAAGLHLAGLGAFFLLALAAMQWLGRYDLAYTQNGAVPGVTATDAAVRLPLAAVTAVTSIVIAALLLVVAARRSGRTLRTFGLIAGGWYIVLLSAGILLPAAYQQLVVTPNQNSAEAPYIANNIDLTRLGFGLDAWQLKQYTGKAALTAADVSADETTFSNARLWDYRPLAATLDQLQTFRQYYDFTSVDIDRYAINSQPTEVMLSAREMALDKSQANPSWIASHILYTHGYSLAMVPVNGVDAHGLPDLIVKDLPTVSAPGAPTISQPRIYFGERPSDWVLVHARSPEFDYPSSTGNGNDVTADYTGTAGIPIGSLAARLFWAGHFGDLNLLISDQVTDQTKLLLHRSLADRLGTLAPFLSLDADPYLVVSPEGRLVYIQDAYLTSAGLPGATTTADQTLGATYNYIRNSVKITVDAYDGTTHFYVADPSDPLIRAWQGVFPSMFEPLSAMPAGLAAHLRTPEAMFNAQTQMFARYHVTDVASFYKSDNVWTVPSVGQGNDQVLAPEAYYVEIRLPDQAAPEFVLIQPMVPASRPNMIAWVAARNDGAARGQVVVYQLPANTTIQGPAQIEARIDQDPVISAQISLWNQSGSKVIRGNLLVIPVGTSFLYLEPIYLQSTSSAFPQLTKVVVASSETVAWGDTLAGALTAVTSGTGTGGAAGGSGGAGGAAGGSGAGSGSGTGGSGTGGSGTGAAGQPTDIPGLIAYANAHFAAAKAAQARGDFVAYGQELQKVQSALDALNSLGGATPAPSGGAPASAPAPSASASPGP